MNFNKAVVLDSLDNDEELFLEIVGIFLEQLPIYRKSIEEALQAGNNEALSRAAHSAKGAIATFRVAEAVEALQALEYRSKEGAPMEELSLLKSQAFNLLESLENSLQKFR